VPVLSCSNRGPLREGRSRDPSPRGLEVDRGRDRGCSVCRARGSAIGCRRCARCRGLQPSAVRTQMIECTEDGRVLTISYDRLLELYFQNPQFGIISSGSAASVSCRIWRAFEGIIERTRRSSSRTRAKLKADPNIRVEAGSACASLATRGSDAALASSAPRLSSRVGVLEQLSRTPLLCEAVRE
jgi:hypothetical protein